MHLFLFASRDDAPRQRLRSAIHEVIADDAVENFVSLDDFRERLHRIVEPDSIAVLVALNREELLKMQILRKLLPEIYVVLVLPDRTESTLELAHLLLPRFLAHRDDPFTDLQGVLLKMAAHSR
jgi:hypothetical protein